MGIIQERTFRVKTLLEEINNHYMCLYFTEDSTHYQVQHPEGYFPQGIRIEKGANKTRALERLLARMEKHWNDNYPFNK